MRIPLAQPLVSRDGTLGKDAHITNGQVSPEGEVLKRPGCADFGLTTAGQAQMTREWEGRVVTVSGDTLVRATVGVSSITAEATVAITPKAATQRFSGQASAQVADTRQLLLKNSTQAWVYTL